MQDIDNYKIHGTIIRSKEKIILNEEKPTKYFFIQEKQKKIKKHIKSLQNQHGKILTTNSEILECKNYFQNLYTKQKTCEKTQNLLLKYISHKITNEQNNKLTKQIEITEIKEAIQSMENGKSPGLDGIPIEFYKEFIEIIKKDLQKTYN